MSSKYDCFYPANLITLYDVLAMLGFDNDDCLWYNEVYQTLGDAFADSIFCNKLYAMGYDVSNFRNDGIVYFDSESNQNVEIESFNDTELYLVIPFD